MTTERQMRAKELLQLLEQEAMALQKFGYRFPALFKAVGFLLTLEADPHVDGETLGSKED